MFEIELLICIKINFAFNNLQWLICHKTQPNRIKSNHKFFLSFLSYFEIVPNDEMRTTQEFYELFWTNLGDSALQKRCCTATYLSFHKPAKQDEQDMWDTVGEVRTNPWAMLSYELLYMDVPVLTNT